MIIVDKYNKVSAPNFADNLIDSGSFKYALSGPFMLVASRFLTLYLGFCNHNARDALALVDNSPLNVWPVACVVELGASIQFRTRSQSWLGSLIAAPETVIRLS